MSAYGEIRRAHSAAPLPSTAWTAAAADEAAHADGTHITVHHLTLASARALPGLLDYLGAVFAKEVEDGLTYPQEGEMPQPTFEAYFFAADVFVGISGRSSLTATVQASASDSGPRDIEGETAGRRWEDCVAGYYYAPGADKTELPWPLISRASRALLPLGNASIGVGVLTSSPAAQICNAGFVVPPTQRSRGFGRLLARSYVHYAPQLGYQASVFNLVYVNNTASVRLWEKLGFTKAGRIPRAGRLRTADGMGEEYVDAWVFYKSFLDEA